MTKKQPKQTGRLTITLIKSGAGRLPKHCATLKGLGLRKIRQTVVLEDTACVRGMINQIAYLLKVEPYES